MSLEEKKAHITLSLPPSCWLERRWDSQSSGSLLELRGRSHIPRLARQARRSLGSQCHEAPHLLLTDPFPVFFRIRKKLLFCSSCYLFGFPVICSRKLILTGKVLKKKKTEKQREMRGSAVSLEGLMLELKLQCFGHLM